MLLLGMGFLNQVQAQFVYQWANGLGAGGTDVVNKMRKDALGNTYVIGSFQGTVDFDPGPGSANLTSLGSDDVFFAKYSPTGACLWARSIGTPSSDLGLDIKVDASAVYICGSFAYANQSADFDPGPGVATLTSIGNIDAFFGKYDLNGNYLWAHNVASQNNDHGPSISVDGSGNVYIGVMCSVGAIDFDPGPGVAAPAIIAPWNFVIAKYTAAGAYLWARPLAANNTWHWMTELANDAAGNVYCAGYFSGTTDFDPGAGMVNLTPVGGYDACLLKLDAAGNYQWVKQIGGPADDFAQGLVLNPAGTAIYLTGSFKATANFNSGANPMTSVGGDDVFLAKFGNTGAFLWSKRFGGTADEQSSDLALDTCENVYVSGGFNSMPIDLDPAPAAANFNSNGAYDIFVSKYTDQGCYLIGATMGGTGNDAANAVAYDRSNFSTSVAGYTGGVADMDPGGGVANIGGGGQDGFAAQYTPGAIQAPPPANVTPAANLVVCPNQSTVLTVTSNICAGGIRTWYTASSGGVYLGAGDSYTTGPVTANTTFYVQDSICGSVSNRTAITVTVTSNQSVQVTGPTTICSGQSATLTAAGAASYTWSPGGQTTTTIVVSPTVSTTYTLLGAVSGCTAQATYTLSVNLSPTLTVSSNTTVCAGETVTLTASGAPGYTWTPAGTSAPNSATTTVAAYWNETYTVTGGDGICNVQATVSVSVAPTPWMVVTNTTICSGATVSLTASGATSYTWSPGGQNTATLVVSPATSTSYTVTGSNGTCTAQAVSNVAVAQTPTLTVSSATSICSGQSTTLTASGATSYSWSPATGLNTTTAGTVVASPPATTTYTVRGAISTCTTGAVVSVSVSATPTLALSSVTVCSGNVATLSATGATTYTWNTGSNSPSIAVSPAATTGYSVSGSTQGCTATAQATVTVVNPPAVSSTTVANARCNAQNNGSITIVASSVSAYLWSPPVSATNTAINLGPGVYTCTLSAGPGCQLVQTFTVAEPAPLANTNTFMHTTCNHCNGWIDYTTTGGTPPYSYAWLPAGAPQHSNSDLCPAIYTVTVSDANQCSSTYTAEILPSAGVTLTLSPSSALVYPNEPVQLSVSSNEAEVFFWSPAGNLSCTLCSTTTATSAEPMTYCVRGLDDTGCRDSACVRVEIKCGNVYIPNAFSPNNDGHNDVLRVLNNCISTMNLKIFDRWGNMLFESSSQSNCWDGLYQGSAVDPGVYVYQFTALLSDGQEVSKKGNITVVR